MRAALTARSMSAASPSATSAMTSSVAGLIVSNVLPLVAVAPLAVDEHLGLMRVGDFAARFGCRGHWSFSLLRARAILALVPSVRVNPWRHLMTDRCGTQVVWAAGVTARLSRMTDLVYFIGNKRVVFGNAGEGESPYCST